MDLETDSRTDQMSKTLIFPLDSSEYFNMFESINTFHVNKELGL